MTMTLSTGRPDSAAADRVAIRELIENWAVWRDAGHWDRFRTVWHDDGRMMATWTQGTADEFIVASKAGWDKGVSILHFLGGQSIDLAGNRAISQTKMTISQRAEVEGALVDVVCTGRFYDFVERREGRWGLLLRQPIYEKDRMDPVDPSVSLTLDPELLRRFPEGYRHLAYAQSKIGYPVKDDMPGLKGPAVEALYERGDRWLRGGCIGVTDTAAAETGDALKAAFKATMADYPSGVVIVTTIDREGRRQGFTATSFSSLSMSPPSVFVCLAKTAFSYDAFITSATFAINFVGAGDTEMALRFARRGEDKFGMSAERENPHGVPILADAVAFIVCRTETHFISGDHAILVGQVLDTGTNPDREMLVHYRRRFGSVRVIEDRDAALLSNLLGFDGDWIT